MIPSYVFVETDRIDDFADALNRVPGFTVVLHIGDYYQPLDQHDESILTALIADSDVVDISTAYISGDRVSVVYGPLKGLEGQIKHIDRHHRTAFHASMHAEMLSMFVFSSSAVSCPSSRAVLGRM